MYVNVIVITHHVFFSKNRRPLGKASFHTVGGAKNPIWNGTSILGLTKFDMTRHMT